MSLMDYLEHKRREKERQIKWEIAKRKYEDEAKITLGTVIGASLGLAAGLLLAPKSGEETRKDIKKFAEETKKTAVNNFNDAVDTVKLTADNVTDSVKDKYQDFQDRGMTE
ncbi:MAG: YtxH domain-containing protein [Finegoldia magna]|nr:YtxH domain-containing protein [Finegoldia magna]